MECYVAVAAVADRWLDLLDTQAPTSLPYKYLFGRYRLITLSTKRVQHREEEQSAFQVDRDIIEACLVERRLVSETSTFG